MKIQLQGIVSIVKKYNAEMGENLTSMREHSLLDGGGQEEKSSLRR